MTAPDDVGLDLVDHVYRELQIDARWSFRTKRQFTWWAHRFAQTVWADVPVMDAGFKIYRVRAVTDVVRDIKDHRRAIKAAAALAPFSTLSGYTIDAGHLRSECSVFVHAESMPGWKRPFTIAAILQVTDAHAAAEELADLVGGVADESSHPSSGKRPSPDEMLTVRRQVIAPMGAEPSHFIGPDFEAAERFAGRAASLTTTADPSGLAAEFPFGTRTALFRMRTDERHPQLGNGLLCTLRLPTHHSFDEAARLALDFNARERREMTRCQFLGSWCPDSDAGGGVCFVSFHPNACFQPNFATNLLMDGAMRARWVLQSSTHHSYAESAARSESASFRLGRWLRDMRRRR